MTEYELHRVCEGCFNEPRNPPIREDVCNSDGSCRSCGRMWRGINIAYYPPHRQWYRIRKIRHDSTLALCNGEISGRCIRGVKCRRAHNTLELEIWNGIDSGQRPGNRKFMCVICNEEFKIMKHLNSHMMGRAHVAKTRSMRILPEVGHSQRYIGLIRSRPKLTSGRDSYQLCHNFGNHRKVCRSGNGCKHAHSEEELKVWMDALKAENAEHREEAFSKKYYPYNSSSSRNYFSSQGGASSHLSSSASHPYWCTDHSGAFDDGNDPNVLMEVHEVINSFGLSACVFELPNHIRLRCEGPDTVNIMDDESQVMYLVTLNATQLEFLNSIVLYQHKGIFSLGDVYKCSVMKGIREKITHLHNFSKTNYLVFQEFDSDNFLEVPIICQPQIGEFKVFVIFQLRDGLLLAKEIYLKVISEESPNAKDNFRKSTTRPPDPSYASTPEPLSTRKTRVPLHVPTSNIQASAHVPTKYVPPPLVPEADQARNTQASAIVPTGYKRVLPRTYTGEEQASAVEPTGHTRVLPRTYTGEMQASAIVPTGHTRVLPHTYTREMQTSAVEPTGYKRVLPRTYIEEMQASAVEPTGHKRVLPHTYTREMQASAVEPTGYKRVLPRTHTREMQASAVEPTGHTRVLPHTYTREMQTSAVEPTGHKRVLPRTHTEEMQVSAVEPTGHKRVLPHTYTREMQTSTVEPTGYKRVLPRTHTEEMQASAVEPTGYKRVLPRTYTREMQASAIEPTGHTRVPPHVVTGSIQTPQYACTRNMRASLYQPTKHIQAPSHVPTRPVQVQTGPVSNMISRCVLL